jgi:hypothetical protein
MNMKTIYRLLICAALLGAFAFAQKSQYPRTVNFTIAAGGSLSAGVDLKGCTLARMELPTMTSAAVTFQVSEDGGTYKELFDFFGAAVAYPAGTGGVVVVLSPQDWYGLKYMKVRSGTSASAVTQAGGATIKFTCKD